MNDFINQQHDVISALHGYRQTLIPLVVAFEETGNTKMVDDLGFIAEGLRHDADTLSRITGEQTRDMLRQSEEATFNMMGGILAMVARQAAGPDVPLTTAEIGLDAAVGRLQELLDSIGVGSHPHKFDAKDTMSWLLLGIEPKNGS